MLFIENRNLNVDNLKKSFCEFKYKYCNYTRLKMIIVFDDYLPYHIYFNEPNIDNIKIFYSLKLYNKYDDYLKLIDDKFILVIIDNELFKILFNHIIYYTFDNTIDPSKNLHILQYNIEFIDNIINNLNLIRNFYGFRIIETDELLINVSIDMSINSVINNEILIYNKNNNVYSNILYESIDELENYVLFYRQKYG